MKQIIILLFAIIPSALFSQNTVSLGDGKSPKANLSQVAWIAGHWQGEAFGGITEEVWTAPLGNSMLGAFKLVVDNKVKFYEICQIAQESETIIFRLKHFDSKLIGWEEKDETQDFPLVKIEKNAVYFDNFTIKRISEDHIIFYVVMENNGKSEEVEFKYNRVK
ncbi:MAG: hypothetical protein COW03_06125 [Cytophagales bacterium CG12_big_fil_rev_8_21_14_0_65_40_12]|nr:MAG: hypothetical protein COW03_06125 [Cytophagales bacterium CG12_big_fil_rev_8_21_14_0_65_40_12]PIW03635.1 MAG: hypothetical protein COW40_13945 [Cytophagales bacterium CG17_big_fil_post_rev_8_21_14_2_50_40_13]